MTNTPKPAAEKTLRDEFAMSIMAGMSHALLNPEWIKANAPTICRCAYILADAMMKERGL